MDPERQGADEVALQRDAVAVAAGHLHDRLDAGLKQVVAGHHAACAARERRGSIKLQLSCGFSRKFWLKGLVDYEWLLLADYNYMINKEYKST